MTLRRGVLRVSLGTRDASRVTDIVPPQPAAGGIDFGMLLKRVD